MADCKAKILITADGAWRGHKLLILKTTCDDALEKAKTKYGHTIKLCIVVPHLDRVTACGKMPDDVRTMVTKNLFTKIEREWSNIYMLYDRS